MIPFIRMLPNGTTMGESIDRSPVVERMAHRFIRFGGRFLITIHPDSSVELVACMPVSVGKAESFATASCYNDPVLVEAVDQLVRDAERELEHRLRVH